MFIVRHNFVKGHPNQKSNNVGKHAFYLLIQVYPESRSCIQFNIFANKYQGLLTLGYALFRSR